MQVRAPAEGMHLVQVAALVRSLASVQRLVHIGDQVHECVFHAMADTIPR
ncbi:hypothetical protein LRM40_11990 [Ideonella dechloratans]|nr:hypothetical protein [Ideonella dechloratans]UFU09032.1 hypothetical protein LRM40_11990 [Ideonella dechloratans]